MTLDLRIPASLIGALLLAAGPALAGDAEAGKGPYVANCASCHGLQGKGDGPVGVAIEPRPRDFSQAEFKYDTDGDAVTGSDADLRNVIRNGAAKYGGSPLMAPWSTLSDADVTNVIAYIRSLSAP